MDEKQDGRKQNNPHPAVREAGAEAARRGDPVYSCPYSHPSNAQFVAARILGRAANDAGP